MSDTVITSVGNAGFVVEHGGLTLAIDPFFGVKRSASAAAWLRAFQVRHLDVLLFTHDHWDHFHAGVTAELVRQMGSSVVVGTGLVCAQLRQAGLSDAALVELTPGLETGRPFGASQTAVVHGTQVTAFRTPHGQEHNSYLVELPGLRFFHDGDSENTRTLDPRRLGALDVLFLATWLGAGWVEFVEALKPRHWLIMHMAPDELLALARGEYFRDLCDHVPQQPVALNPGESWRLTTG